MLRRKIWYTFTKQNAIDAQAITQRQKITFLQILLRWSLNINRSTLIGLSFVMLIFAGTLLLSLPVAHQNGQWAHPLDALFTATSASCVTGLVVWDTANELTLFGQLILVFLIQVGGIGIMTISTLFSIGFGRRMKIRQLLLVQESLNQDVPSNVMHVALNVLKYTFITEFIFGTLLALYFFEQMGAGSFYWGYWHAVSAFCNAGFDLAGNFDSFVGFQSDIFLNLCLILLIIIGGIGFTVIDDVLTKRCWRKLTLHSKIVLTVNGALIAVGTLIIWLLEQHNAATLGGLNIAQQWLAALFQAVSLRTAGFNTINLAALTNATLFFMVGMMFIGASPASTGGGIKTTTFAVLLASTVALLRDKKDVVLFNRRIDTPVIHKSLAIFLLAISWCLLAIFLLLVLDDKNQPVQFVIFEVISAMGTVGMGVGITPEWNSWCKLVLIATMFIGRIGILTFGMSFFNKKADHLRYPTENIMIG